jgi:AraC-like DNA-binding protein
MRSTLKRKLAVGATATAAAAFAGGAYAATQSGTSSRQALLNDIAKRLNVSPRQLKSAMEGAFDDQLQAAVSAGKITHAQANAIKQRAQQQGVPQFGLGGLHRFGGPGLFGNPARQPLRAGGRLSAAAKYLGLTETQLFNQLTSGKSLAQIASARGKSKSGLTDAMAGAVKARLEKAVAAQMLTSAQEQKVLARLPSILGKEVNRRGASFGPRGFERHFGPRGTHVYPGRPGSSPPPATSALPGPPASSSPVY